MVSTVDVGTYLRAGAAQELAVVAKRFAREPA
jgi:hypothetical protein